MGTRNLTMVISNGKTKIAQYGQWDGYPSGQGLTILRFLQKADLDKFKQKVESLCQWVSQRQLNKWYREVGQDPKEQFISMDKKNKFKANHPQLDRDMAADVLDFVYHSEEPVFLSDNSEFIKDGLFCEWAYIINLDEGTFQVKNGADKTYSLKKLPSEKKFLKELEGQEA